MSEIQNTIIKTNNVKNAMTSFASENFTPLNECDFEIQTTTTYIKTSFDDEFRLFNEDINEIYKDEKDIINQHVEIGRAHV